MLLLALLALLVPCSAYTSRVASPVHQYTRFGAKIPRSFAASRVNARLSPFDAFTAENSKALKDISGFWGKRATDSLHWSKPFASVVENGFESGEISWFKDGELNICYNCIDRHLPHLADKPAIIFEGDLPEETKTLTYAHLHEEVCKLANAMKQYGIQKGDVVTTYMPSCPELVTVMLASARIGAIHNVVHTSLSPWSLQQRVNETSSKYIFTFDELQRKGTRRFIKQDVDEAIKSCSSVKHVFVYRRTQGDVPLTDDRDVILNNVLHLYKNQHDCVAMQSDDPLFLLYSTSTSGPQNGFVHSSAGYALQASLSTQTAFDLRDNDVVGVLIDPGLIAGTTYSVYGPLLNGATTFLFGGSVGHPTYMRYLEMAKRHKLTHLYASSTAFRLIMRDDPLELKLAKLPNLRVIGTIGEPLDEKTYTWLHDVVGKKNCTVVNGWMQTQSGVLLCSTVPGVTPAKPSTCGFPQPGVDLCVVGDDGTEITENPAEGKLLVKQPWPAMARRFFGNATRFEERYLKPFPGRYYTGDFGKRDEDGQYSIEGAAEDIINSGGYRISCSELETAILGSGMFNDTAVVGLPHDHIGQSICAFVVAKPDHPLDLKQAEQFAKQSAKSFLGLFAGPDTVHIVTSLPRTASGELVRSVLAKLALGQKEGLDDEGLVAEKGLVAKLIKQVKTKEVLVKGSPTSRQVHRMKKLKKQKERAAKKA